MGLLRRIGEIWALGPDEEALNMLSDWEFDYAYYVDPFAVDELKEQIESGLYADAFYYVQEEFQFVDESEMMLFLRLLEEASEQ